VKLIGLLVLFSCLGLPAGAAGTELYEQGLAAEAEGRGAEARAHYERAAKSGSGKAAKRLGEIYSKGTPGVAVDFAQSLRWHNLARVLGDDPPSGIDPARSFEQAHALERDGNGWEAVELYKTAARGGNAPAMVRLGQVYEHGLLGRQRDYAEALKWYNAARMLGAEVPLKKP
jgi:TPR repeat protein